MTKTAVPTLASAADWIHRHVRLRKLATAKRGVRSERFGNAIVFSSGQREADRHRSSIFGL